LLWGTCGLFALGGLTVALIDYFTPMRVRTDVVNIEDWNPRCVSERGGYISFRETRHNLFVERGLTGLTAPGGGDIILVDYDELSKDPPEYRDFVLRAACARALGQDAHQADCTAIKRVRDERQFSKEQVAVIMQHLAASLSDADDKSEPCPHPGRALGRARVSRGRRSPRLL
jgi:hypothetical protein